MICKDVYEKNYYIEPEARKLSPCYIKYVNILNSIENSKKYINLKEIAYIDQVLLF